MRIIEDTAYMTWEEYIQLPQGRPSEVVQGSQWIGPSLITGELRLFWQERPTFVSVYEVVIE